MPPTKIISQKCPSQNMNNTCYGLLQVFQKNDGILVEAKNINVNGKYDSTVHKKWEIWSDFP